MHRVTVLFAAVALLVATTLIGLATAQTSAARASGTTTCDPKTGRCVTCDPYTGVCQVTVTQPGSPGTPGDPGSPSDPGTGPGNDPGCHWGGTSFPCSDPNLGWFNNQDGCYYRLADPQPPPGDAVWEGHDPGDGAVYTQTCEGLTDQPLPGGGWMVQPRGTATVWLAQPPPGSPDPVLPAATYAEQAVAKLAIPTLSAESNAKASQSTYVAVPTTLWIDPADWAPTHAQAGVPERTVTLTATPVSTTWSMGDGNSVRCAGPGTPFSAAHAEDPSCGYTYRVSSAGQPQTGGSPNDRYFTVQGEVDFALHWTCTSDVAGGCDQAAGDLPDIARPTTPMPLRVLEVQAVVVGN